MRFWDEVANLPGLSPVIDYARQETPWARYITRLHLLVLQRRVALEPTQRYLDYGCGVGRITDWLAPRVTEVTGVDASDAMLQVARRRNRHPNVAFRRVVDPADLAVDGLDGITAVWVLQHILDDAEFDAVLDFMARAVKPGGSVYCIDRLCRDAVDPGESDYLRLRRRGDYEAAFRVRGFVTVVAHPVSVDEQVLGRPNLTRRIKNGSLCPGLWARLDLAWARRQADPFIADMFWRFQRT